MKVQVKGSIEIFLSPPGLIGPPVPVQRVDNIVVDRGLQLIAGVLAFESGYTTGITHCDIGTGTAAPAGTQTSLTTPLARVPATGISRNGASTRLRFFFSAAAATGHLREIGSFGHSSATTSVSTGLMFNRALINVDNSAGDRDVTTIIEISFARA